MLGIGILARLGAKLGEDLAGDHHRFADKGHPDMARQVQNADETPAVRYLPKVEPDRNKRPRVFQA
jgi:hypothetical protein